MNDMESSPRVVGKRTGPLGGFIRHFARLAVLLLAGSVALSGSSAVADETAYSIVKAAVDHWRGTASRGAITMTIHRPDWERTMSIRSWTRGNNDSLIRVTRPKRDAGNATLAIEDNMWTFSPKVNRVIKIPSSMMNQNWMGSDFSNRDISRVDDIVDQYTHTLVETRKQGNHRIYIIRSVPLEEAAVVWGYELLAIREDYIILEQSFHDQDGIKVKSMVTTEIGERGGRTIATRQRMSNVETANEWTEIFVEEMEFDVKLGNTLFTLSNLRNPRE